MGHLTSGYVKSPSHPYVATGANWGFDILCLPHCAEFDIRVCQIPTIAPYNPEGGWWGNTLIGALAVEPSLLYLIGSDPTDPVVVWRTLADQFQCKTWANKLELKRKLFSLRLAEGGSVQEHVKLMIEICEELSVIGEAISEEDQVVYLLASLPESYNVLVTALEASADVPTLAVVKEGLLHEETKMKSRSNQLSQEGALTTSFKKKLRCHFCNKLGHFKKDCEEFAKVKSQA